MTGPSANPDSYLRKNGAAWSKANARTVFDAAPDWELNEVIQQAEQMANQIQGASGRRG